MIEQRGSAGTLRTVWREARTELLLFAAFFLAYAAGGVALGLTGILTSLNHLFHADTTRVVMDMTAYGAEYTSRTSVHPLFSLVFKPVGIPLALITGSQTLAAVLMNAVIAAAGVAALRRTVMRWTPSPTRATLYAILFGTSGVIGLWSIVPSTTVPGGAAVSLVFFAAVVAARVTPALLATGVLATGMVTTNAAPAAMVFAARHWPAPMGALLKKTAAYGVIVLLIVALLNGMQHLIFPVSELAFVPGVAEFESKFIMTEASAAEHVTRIGRLASFMALYGVVTPATMPTPKSEFVVLKHVDDGRPYITINKNFPENLPWRAIPATALWLALAGWALRGLVKGRTLRDPIAAAAGLTVLFNFALHSFYGDNFMLYAAHWLPAIVILVAAGAEAHEPRRWTTPFLAVTTAAVALNTLLFLHHIHGLYA